MNYRRVGKVSALILAAYVAAIAAMEVTVWQPYRI